MRLRAKGALAEAAGRVTGSRFAKPVARLVLVAVGLLGLAALGHSAGAGAAASAAAAAAAAAATSESIASPVGPLAPAVAAAPAAGAGDTPVPPSASHAPASTDDPVVLNAATVDDLRRLPGVGPKRADAILALRMRLGRFRAVEDLLKVKGIGRATLKRLRPLVRLDAPNAGEAALRLKSDAGAPPNPSASSPGPPRAAPQ